jgi:hypothetical protein
MDKETENKIESIQLFHEKIGELKNSSYTKFVSQNKIRASIRYNFVDKFEIIKNHPDEEAIKSLVLTIRLFIQKKDRISIGNILSYMKDLDFDNELIEKYERGFENLNAFLDSTSVIYNNEVITYRKIIDVFFYGYFAHVDKDKYKIYKKWLNDYSGFEFRKTSLLGALNNIVRFLLFFENAISLELNKLKENDFYK